MFFLINLRSECSAILSPHGFAERSKRNCSFGGKCRFRLDLVQNQPKYLRTRRKFPEFLQISIFPKCNSTLKEKFGFSGDVEFRIYGGISPCRVGFGREIPDRVSLTIGSQRFCRRVYAKLTFWVQIAISPRPSGDFGGISILEESKI